MSLFDQFNWQGEQGFPYWSGYYWIGPVQPHIIPPQVGMTDRTTGQVWYITLNAGGTLLVLVTTKPPGPQRILGASDYLPVGNDGYGLYTDNTALVSRSSPCSAISGLVSTMMSSMSPISLSRL